MHHVEIKRAMGESDIAALSQLIEAASTADGHRALGEHKWLDLVQGGRAGFAGFIARETGNTPQIIGYAQLSHGGDGSWAVEFVVHPDRRDAEPSLGVELVRTALDEVAAAGGGHVHLWVPKPDETDDSVAAAVGLHRGRDLFQMRRPLPADAGPSRIATRPFSPGKDEQAWLEVNNRAFRSHPEQGSWTLETFAEREAQDWFDPGGLLLHEVGGDLAGFCWTKVQVEDGEPIGEIYVIAVNPDFQHRGLGRELVIAGLDHLSSEGLRTAMLYVDRDNTAARDLYFSLGFEDDHVDRAYTGDVAPSSA